MYSRSHTADQHIIALSRPDNRKFDFTKTPDTHAVRITVPKDSSWKGWDIYWTETFSVQLNCVEGRIHTFSGTGLYDNVDSFFGSGNGQTYEAFEFHLWQREEEWFKGKGSEGSKKLPFFRSGLVKDYQGRPMPEVSRKQDSELSCTEYSDKDLTVDISPGRWAPWREEKRQELFYRHLASTILDAPVYPYLPSTPFPIRLLFSLPSFLFPAALRRRLVAWFLSIQFLVLCSVFDHHPYLGSLPVANAYATLYWYIYLMPLPPRLPEWVCRLHWECIIFVSHFKVWVWSAVGTRLLGMRPAYEEYTPERLKDVLDDEYRDVGDKVADCHDVGAMV